MSGQMTRDILLLSVLGWDPFNAIILSGLLLAGAKRRDAWTFTALIVGITMLVGACFLLVNYEKYLIWALDVLRDVYGLILVLGLIFGNVCMVIGVKLWIRRRGQPMKSSDVDKNKFRSSSVVVLGVTAAVLGCADPTFLTSIIVGSVSGGASGGLLSGMLWLLLSQSALWIVCAVAGTKRVYFIRVFLIKVVASMKLAIYRCLGPCLALLGVLLSIFSLTQVEEYIGKGG